jgi:TctA family transporter
MFGAFYGLLVGILPGLSPTAAAAVLAPLFLGVLTIEQTLIILTSIMYGSQYGGSVGAILFRQAGESSSAVTIIDGNKIAEQGKAVTALWVSAMSSFIAGILTVGVMSLSFNFLTPLIGSLSTIDHLAIVVVALTLCIVTVGGDLSKSYIALLIGYTLGAIGVFNGVERFTFGVATLKDGIDMLIITVIFFGMVEIISKLFTKELWQYKIITKQETTIDKEYVKRSIWPTLRGTVIGWLGIFPGAGFSIAPVLSRSLETKISKNPEKFGNGAIEAVAGPEAANNSAGQSLFVPLFLFGVPTGGITALMIMYMVANNIPLGSLVIQRAPDLIWLVLASMVLINCILVVLCTTLSNSLSKTISFGRNYLNVIILFFCMIGITTVTYTLADTFIFVLLVLFGVILYHNGFNMIYIFMGFILGPMVEEHSVRVITLLSYNNHLWQNNVFSITVIICCLMIMILSFFKNFTGKNK